MILCNISSAHMVNVHTKNTYHWIISEVNHKELNIFIKKKKKFDKKELESLFNKIIEKAENNGYPFSKIEFK